jgi:nucleoside-diphosphate-sugar epimerase
MRIGLTGASGVLGHRIRRALTRGENEVFPFEGDVRDLGELELWAPGCDCIIHAAALVPVQEVSERVAEAISTNVAGAANVARAAAKAGDVRLVYISTSHVYGSSTEPIDEDWALDPVSLYGLSKLQGEQWVRALAKRPLIIRVFSFFDSRQANTYLGPALATRISAAGRGQDLPLMGAHNIRDIADATWLGEVCARLAVGTAEGVVNCGVGKGHTVLEVATRLGKAMGREDLRWIEAGSGEPNALVADISRLTSILGSPPPFDLDDALRRLVAKEENPAA